MIKIYVMQTCPDCTFVEEQINDDTRYEVIDIGSDVRKLKEFISLRDHHPAFEEAKREGFLGIPCFVLDNGVVTLNPEEAGFETNRQQGVSCSLNNRNGC